ncbi:hypothetical protein HKK80_11245 [Halonotius sp. F2-221B]|uniref:hypothetical protein n=1 Tax=Halonotius sp. F2-221B TaxID=2731620 RepID=UPI00398A6B5C
MIPNMVNRREVLTGATVVIGITTIAGCSGSNQPADEQTDGQNQTTEQEQEQDQENSTQNQSLTNFELNWVEFSYTISSGLSSEIRATNTTEQGTDPNEVNIRINVYNGEERIGSDNQWETVPATYHQDFELEIPEVSETSETTIEDASELIVQGKERDEEYIDLRTISGDELRGRVSE